MELSANPLTRDELWERNQYLIEFQQATDAYTLQPDPLIFTDVLRQRHDLIDKFGFAIPNAPALELIAQHAPIVELGAGCAYWASLLQASGVEVVPIDKHPQVNAWTDVLSGEVKDLDAYPHHTLMMIWPPLENPMAKDALRTYKGDYLLYVGESADGCCADPGFFDNLHQDWRLLANIRIPAWPLIHDSLFLYMRKPT